MNDRVKTSASAGPQSPLAEPIWFGDLAKPLFGWFHAAQGDARDCAVVLCNPFGYDTMITHYSYRHLAEQLARAGIAALRFDYFGTGDSFGEDTSDDRTREWLASIDAARTQASSLSGARQIVLFGMKVGGLLALASAQANPVDALVLLGPSISGKAALRELRALRMMQTPIPAPGNPEGRASDDENFGFLMTEPMRAALAQLDPLATAARAGARALVIARDDAPGGEKALVEHLRANGTVVTDQATPGYALALRGDPYTRELPLEAWSEIVAWLSLSVPLRDGAAPPVTTSADGSSTSGAEISVGAIREEAVRFGGLFGILTEPGEGSGPRARTCVLLINIGANHRIGSNRMYVRWARAWAQLGFRALRFDLSGIGDSPRLEGQLEKDVYSPSGISQTRAAIDFLSQRGADRFVLAGLCSGAYIAYYAALEDPRANAIVLVNPPTFHWKEGDSLELRTRKAFQATSFYKQRARSIETWKRLARGEIHVRHVLLELARRALVRGRNRAAAALVQLGITREPDDIARGFQSLATRGCDALLLYGSNDGGVDVMEEHLGTGARKMQHAETFQVELLDGTDHTFTPRDAQERLLARITAHLVERIGDSNAG